MACVTYLHTCICYTFVGYKILLITIELYVPPPLHTYEVTQKTWTSCEEQDITGTERPTGGEGSTTVDGANPAMSVCLCRSTPVGVDGDVIGAGLKCKPRRFKLCDADCNVPTNSDGDDWNASEESLGTHDYQDPTRGVTGPLENFCASMATGGGCDKANRVLEHGMMEGGRFNMGEKGKDGSNTSSNPGSILDKSSSVMCSEAWNKAPSNRHHFGGGSYAANFSPNPPPNLPSGCSAAWTSCNGKSGAG